MSTTIMMNNFSSGFRIQYPDGGIKRIPLNRSRQYGDVKSEVVRKGDGTHVLIEDGIEQETLPEGSCLAFGWGDCDGDFLPIESWKEIER